MSIHATLQDAFTHRADGVRGSAAPLVGVFGDGVPLPLVSSFGAFAADIKAPPLSDHREGPVAAEVTKIAEPFLDTFAARFLHRFAAGAFDHFATLIFARDDTAGLAAYQYATELRRQGKVAKTGPDLFLWNLLHTRSAPAAAFNVTELTRLTRHLEQVCGARSDQDRLTDAIADEVQRADAIAALPPGGSDVFVAINAGRWLPPQDHITLLPDLPRGTGPAITLAGTACDIPVLHAIAEEFGHVHADLQDFGRRAPQPADAQDLLRQIVEDPLSPRAAPPSRFSAALADGIAGSDLVITTVDKNDDSFGWEVPGLKSAAQTQGSRFLDLGFRPFRPDDAWQDMARARIAEVLA